MPLLDCQINFKLTDYIEEHFFLSNCMSLEIRILYFKIQISILSTSQCYFQCQLSSALLADIVLCTSGLMGDCVLMLHSATLNLYKEAHKFLWPISFQSWIFFIFNIGIMRQKFIYCTWNSFKMLYLNKAFDYKDLMWLNEAWRNSLIIRPEVHKQCQHVS